MWLEVPLVEGDVSGGDGLPAEALPDDVPSAEPDTFRKLAVSE